MHPGAPPALGHGGAAPEVLDAAAQVPPCACTAGCSAAAMDVGLHHQWCPFLESK